MNPLQGHLQSGLVPLSEEWFIQQKKLLKESGMEKTSAAAAANDIYTPSEAAQAEQADSKQAPETPQEAFLESARTEIMKLDPNAANFVSNATSKLVDSALGEVFGDRLSGSPGYPQMQAKITNTILGDDRYREVVEDFLDVLVRYEYSRFQNMEPLAEQNGQMQEACTLPQGSEDTEE